MSDFQSNDYIFNGFTTGNLFGSESFVPNISTSNSATPAAILANIEENNKTIPVFKMIGYYPIGEVYEIWVVQNAPSIIPPSGHTLINVAVIETWRI